MSREAEDVNRRLLRARDAMDRGFAEPLDVPALARIAIMSPAHFIREFRRVFGETPHRYLQRGWLAFLSNDVDADFERLKAAGVDITQEPTDQAYGRDFGIRDPFGNAIRIGSIPAYA